MVSLTAQILARDEAETLRDAIASARRLQAEVVVGVDTASVDNTRELATTLADSVVDIDFMSACGGSFAAAHNRLAASGSGDWRIKLDGHEKLAEDAVEPLLSTLSQCGDRGGAMAWHRAEAAYDRRRGWHSGDGVAPLASWSGGAVGPSGA